MSEPFLGEIKLMSFNFAPRGWAFCGGLPLAINQNQALFALLGTMYGGDGITTFALPNLQGRVPIHMGSGFTQGQTGGQESHTLSQAEMPAHNHSMVVSSDTTTDIVPTGKLLGNSGTAMYGNPNNLVALQASSVLAAGGSQAHSNMQPYLTLNFCIALQGIFPSRN